MKFSNKKYLLRRQFAVQSAPGVFERSDWLKMIGIYTWTNAAKMVENKTIWNRANTSFVIDSVRNFSAAILAGLSVAVLINAELPDPARRLVSTILNQIAHPFAHVVIMNEAHRVVFQDAQDEVALRGYRRFLAASAKAKSGWIGRWNFDAAWQQIHGPLQVDGGGNPGGTRHLTSVSKADAQPHFCDVDWILA